jgi:hypothetical protein
VRFALSPFPLSALTCAVAALDKLHAKHVLPGFSDRSQEEREIEALTTDITRVISSILFSPFTHMLLPGFSPMSGSHPESRL